MREAVFKARYELAIRSNEKKGTLMKRVHASGYATALRACSAILSFATMACGGEPPRSSHPVAEHTAITINAPEGNSSVGERVVVQGTIRGNCRLPWVLVHPMSTGSTIWVQPKPIVGNDGVWRVNVYVGGAGAQEGAQFELLAIACPHEALTEGKTLREVPEAEALSNTILVTRKLPTAVSADPAAASAPIQPEPAAPDYESKPDARSGTSAATDVPEDGAECTPLEGLIGASDEWGSGWIVLERLTDFPAKAELRFEVGGTAEKILVRLLRAGADPNTAAGELGKYDVPGDRHLAVKLPSARREITQISVHGGPKPFGRSLKPGNGGATIESVCRMASK